MLFEQGTKIKFFYRWVTTKIHHYVEYKDMTVKGYFCLNRAVLMTFYSEILVNIHCSMIFIGVFKEGHVTKRSFIESNVLHRFLREELDIQCNLVTLLVNEKVVFT